ncbi:MAG: right-handed parallel beta-helix repeat-containing protein [Phycisphaerales bacterium]|nr:right-handed parallel beta-helix repeat-containing protein [Phycisphaerales bacterium]
MIDMNIVALTAAALVSQVGTAPRADAPTTPQNATASPQEAQSPADPLPVVEITADNTKITRSCIIRIAPGTVIADADNNGVIQIDADDVTVTFEQGSALRGATPQTPWDTLAGVGLRVDGHKGVKIDGARIHGFKVGLYASGTPGLELTKIDASDNFRQHLKSTPVAEDASDWLYPHHNDDHQWMKNYGAAIYVEQSDNVVIRNVLVRRGQNGIVLDRVNESKIYDNDCSFISGWGVAMWRSSKNVICRNALDFCVRGHVEGVYNRGQDSAGILMFEQCSNNQILENSVTHGGDGLFSFAGLEAIGESPAPSPDFDYTRRGCNDNFIMDNDFSFAPAHGLEMTFSFGNVIVRNRMAENAICGIWGGYSQDMLIVENMIHGNGGMAYGLERGGINIEHGAGNRIYLNNMQNNRCAIHLWWDDDKDLLQKPGVKANYHKGQGNKVVGNSILFDKKLPFKDLRPDEKLIALQIRDPLGGSITDLGWFQNRVVTARHNAIEMEIPDGITLYKAGALTAYNLPKADRIGDSRPVSNRSSLRGRDTIIMTEWGPWDHESPLVRQSRAGAGEIAFDLFKFSSDVDIQITAKGVTPTIVKPSADAPNASVTLKAQAAGVYPFELSVSDSGYRQVVSGVLMSASWDATFFTWTKDTDPREKIDAWRALAAAPDAKKATLDNLSLKFAMGGPGTLAVLKDKLGSGAPANDHFGVIATSKLRVPKGAWKISTTSDDGVRVLVDGKPVIENWTWHAPTKNDGTFTVDNDAEVSVTVEYFEIDGYSTLEFELAPAAK